MKRRLFDQRRLKNQETTNRSRSLNIVEFLRNVGRDMEYSITGAENRKDRRRGLRAGRVANFVSDVPGTEIRGRCKIDLSPDLLPRTNKAGYRAWPAAASSKRAIGALSRGIYTIRPNPYFTRATLIAAPRGDGQP